MNIQNFKISSNFSQIIKSTLNMAAPIVGARVTHAVNAFLCMIMIAHLGHAQLAAGALINSVSFVLLVPLFQLFFAVGVLVGHNYGAQQHHEIGAVVRQGLLLGIILGIPVMLILQHVDAILVLFGQERHLTKLTQAFYDGYLWGVIPGLWSVCLGQFATGISKQKLALVCSLISTPLLLGIGWILMFGKFGCPALGIIGMGYTNAIVFVIIDILLLLYIGLRHEFKPYKLWVRDKKIINHYLREIFDIGWPIALMFVAELALFSLSTIFVGWLGESQLAAWQITLQINLLAFMFPMGIGQAGTILVSQEIGRANYQPIRYLGYVGLLLGILCIVICSLVYLFMPKYLIVFYLNVKSAANYSTVHLAVTLLAVSTLMNVFDALRSVAACVLRGLRDTVVPMFIFVGLGGILGLPIGYYLAFPLHLGAVGFRWGAVISFFIGTVILLHRLYKFTDVKFIAERFTAPR